MRILLYIAFVTLTLLSVSLLNGQCDPIEYSVFYDSQNTTVPPELQTGDIECYTITPNLGFQTGAIWSNATIDLNSSFEYSYYVNLGSNDGNGADGIVFVLSSDPAGQAAIGETGLYLSYGGVSPISPSIALEFDTWDNGVTLMDIPNDHAMLHINGQMDGSAGPAIDLGNIEDGEYHLVEVVWDAVGMNLTISFDDLVIIDQSIDLVNDIFGGDPDVLIGFTGSTGGSTNTQIVCDIQVIYTEECNGIDDDCDGIIDEDTEIEVSQDIFICEGDSYTISDSEYSMSGVYVDTLQSIAGCDSIITTDLQVGEVVTYINEVQICEGESYQEGMSEYTETGIYTDTYQNSAGCDSIIQTELTVNPNIAIENQVSICEGEVYQEGSSFYSVSGTYDDAYQTSAGCDSLVTTILEVLDVDTLGLQFQICEGESITTPQEVYNSSGNYEEVYVAQNGCDSLVEISIEVLPVFSSQQQRYICSGGQFSIGDNSYTESGQYSDTLVALNGCDSVVTTTLGVIDELTIADSTICENQVFQLDMNPFPFHSVNGFTSIDNGVYEFAESGIGSVEVDLDGCILVDDFQLDFIPLYFNEETAVQLCEDESISLTGRDLDIDFQWLSGETEETLVVFQAGEYIKEYEYQCGDFQDRFMVEPRICNCSVYMPTAFTPDNDKVNDLFGPIFNCDFSRYEFSIYDRFGNVMFYSENPDQKWNGGVGEYYVSPGVYQYLLIYSSVDQVIAKDEIRRGVVSVIR